MNLTTRCPACKTAFKVVPDQLKISSGWVRCGRCAEVFDANSNLIPESTSPSKVTTKNTVITNDQREIINIPKANAEKSPNLKPITNQEKIAQADNDDFVNTIIEAENRSVQMDRSAGNDVTELTFVKEANRKAFWQRSTTTRLMLLSLLVSAMLLTFQITYDQRHYLAAKNATWHHALTAACESLSCSIEADKQIEALKIESSSYRNVQSTIDGEIADLKVSIRNTATSPIAVPALELSLTDTYDRTVLKRVLTPKELDFKEPTIAALKDSQISVRLIINLPQTPTNEKSPITGYRVLAFYP